VQSPSLEKMPGVSRRRVDTPPLACLALDRCWRRRRAMRLAFGLREDFTIRG
jgi:exopolyphosphatase/guanosine-5'-triphosphate,3'-diphosphate pyrophosphatase